MPPQQYEWTCSVCSIDWVLGATGVAPNLGRDECAEIVGMPECVNSTYGLMSAQCAVDTFASFDLASRQAWVSFDQAYAVARITTGLINPVGMYHYMAIRGTQDDLLWVANSASGYMGVTDFLDRSLFNSLGPVQVIYLLPRQPTV